MMKKKENYFKIIKQINSFRKKENEHCPSSALEIFQFNITLNYYEWALSTMHILICINSFGSKAIKICAEIHFPEHENSNIFQNCF